MGPDGKLYFNVGAPGNIVMPSYAQATINRVDSKSGVMEVYARGVRNSVGFDWDRRTKEFWFTNHARDWVREVTSAPPCESDRSCEPVEAADVDPAAPRSSCR